MAEIFTKIHELEKGRLKLYSTYTDSPQTNKNLLQIPGCWAGKKAYEEQSRILAKEEGINNHTLELSGHGWSDEKEKPFGLMTLNDYTDDVHAAVTHLTERNGKSSIIAAGHSMGAKILERYVTKYNDLKELILLSSGDVWRGTIDYLKKYKIKGGINLLKTLVSFNVQALISDPKIAAECLFSKIVDESEMEGICQRDSLMAFLDMIFNSPEDVIKVQQMVRNKDLIVWMLQAEGDNIFRPEIADDRKIQPPANNVKVYSGGEHYLMRGSKKEEVASDIARIVKEGRLF